MLSGNHPCRVILVNENTASLIINAACYNLQPGTFTFAARTGFKAAGKLMIYSISSAFQS